MPSRKLTIFVLIIIAAIAIINTAQQKKPLPEPLPEPEVGGFFVNQPGPTDSLASFKTHSHLLDEIYPLWYSVRPDGSLRDKAIPEVIALAKKQGIKVIPLVNLVPSIDTVILDTKTRERAIANIVREVKQHNYDGVNIDFEFIPTSKKWDFSVNHRELTQFMKTLHEKLKHMGKETHMSVLPHVEVPAEMAGVYNYGDLAPYVDKVTLMCYDHHQSGSKPGPIAPLRWVEENVQLAIKHGFKPSQICLGVANYGYDWPARKKGGFPSASKEILEDARLKGYQLQWSEEYQESFYTYNHPTLGKRVVWFEDATNLTNKLGLVNKYKLSGICFWRLGYEDENFWRVIARQQLSSD